MDVTSCVVVRVEPCSVVVISWVEIIELAGKVETIVFVKLETMVLAGGVLIRVVGEADMIVTSRVVRDIAVIVEAGCTDVETDVLVMVDAGMTCQKAERQPYVWRCRQILFPPAALTEVDNDIVVMVVPACVIVNVTELATVLAGCTEVKV